MSEPTHHFDEHSRIQDQEQAGPRLEVPYHEQINNFACGAAVLQMALDYAGIQVDQTRLIELLNVIEDDGPYGGTQEVDMVRVASAFGCEVDAQQNATLMDITSRLTNQLPVIVGYIERTDQQGHFGLVIGIRDNILIMHDPIHGPNYEIDIATFLQYWYAESGEVVRWMMTVKKAEASIAG